MKIGILTYRQAPYISANTAIAYILGQQFVNSENEIVYIGIKQDPAQDNIKSYKDGKIMFLNDSVKESRSFIEKIASKVFGDKARLRQKTACLRRIVQNEKIDVLLCVIAPLEDILIAFYADLEIPVFLYQLDPFYNGMDTENKKQKKLFIKISDKMRHVFTTELLYDIYKDDKDIKSIIEKFSVVQFPKLIKPAEANFIQKFPSEQKIRILYAGSLYSKIRSPEILINLKKILPPECEFVFCGGCDNDNEAKEMKNAGIICKGYRSQEVLAEETARADILLNVGNLVKNQLGSKIIDYISTGKPILNIFQIENCPTLKVLAGYKYSLSVKAEALAEKSAKEKIENFVLESKGNVSPWTDIYERYKEFTPEYAAAKILKFFISDN